MAEDIMVAGQLTPVEIADLRAHWEQQWMVRVQKRSFGDRLMRYPGLVRLYVRGGLPLTFALRLAAVIFRA